jgi:hypothetical protein
MPRVELAKSKDGRLTVLRIKDPTSFPSQPSVRLRWYAENKCLGSTGWQNSSYDLPISSCHKELAIGIDARITNYIEGGTPVEVSIPNAEVKEELVWPSRLGGIEYEVKSEAPDKAEKALLAEAEAKLNNAQEKIVLLETELDKLRNRQERSTTQPKQPASKGWGTWSSSSKARGRAVAAAAVVVGIALGAAAMFGVSRLTSNKATLDDGASVVQLQNDLTRLRMEAFAPLAHDLTALPDRSPKGDTADSIASQGLPADKVGVVEDRARTFLNHGIEMASRGDTNEAVYWYRQALSLCPSDAMLYLGDAYLNGDGAAHDARTGFQLMRMSSSLGTPRATDLLKGLLQRGQIPLAPRNFSDLYQRSH